jgi:hypothetical protein
MDRAGSGIRFILWEDFRLGSPPSLSPVKSDSEQSTRIFVGVAGAPVRPVPVTLLRFREKRERNRAEAVGFMGFAMLDWSIESGWKRGVEEQAQWDGEDEP